MKYLFVFFIIFLFSCKSVRYYDSTLGGGHRIIISKKGMKKYNIIFYREAYEMLENKLVYKFEALKNEEINGIMKAYILIKDSSDLYSKIISKKNQKPYFNDSLSIEEIKYIKFACQKYKRLYWLDDNLNNYLGWYSVADF